MLKHICVMTSKSYGGSYGVGDTAEAARKKARSILGEKPHETEMRTAEVPDGHHLEFHDIFRGVSWRVVPDEQPTVVDSFADRLAEEGEEAARCCGTDAEHITALHEEQDHYRV